MKRFVTASSPPAYSTNSLLSSTTAATKRLSKAAEAITKQRNRSPQVQRRSLHRLLASARLGRPSHLLPPSPFLNSGCRLPVPLPPFPASDCPFFVDGGVCARQHGAGEGATHLHARHSACSSPALFARGAWRCQAPLPRRTSVGTAFCFIAAAALCGARASLSMRARCAFVDAFRPIVGSTVIIPGRVSTRRYC